MESSHPKVMRVEVLMELLPLELNSIKSTLMRFGSIRKSNSLFLLKKVAGCLSKSSILGTRQDRSLSNPKGFSTNFLLFTWMKKQYHEMILSDTKGLSLKHPLSEGGECG